MSRGPSSVLRVRRSDPRFTLRGPRTGRLAAMHPAPVTIRDDRVLAGSSLAGLSEAPLSRPVGPEPRATARFNKRFSIISL